MKTEELNSKKNKYRFQSMAYNGYSMMLFPHAIFILEIYWKRYLLTDHLNWKSDNFPVFGLDNPCGSIGCCFRIYRYYKCCCGNSDDSDDSDDSDNDGPTCCIPIGEWNRYQRKPNWMHFKYYTIILIILIMVLWSFYNDFHIQSIRSRAIISILQ